MKKSNFVIIFIGLISIFYSQVQNNHIYAQPLSYGASLSVSYPVTTLNTNLIDPTSKGTSINNFGFTLNNNQINKMVNNQMLPVDFNEGLFDSKTNLFYYTTKISNGWGADNTIKVYSIKLGRVVREIKFDNSGYYKYPISISPDSTILVLAERAQSSGDVNLSTIDLNQELYSAVKIHSYTPYVNWIDNNNYLMLTSSSKCNKDNCSIETIEISKFDKTNKKISSQKAVVKDLDGTFPQVESFEIKDRKVMLGKRNRLFDSNVKSINLNPEL